MITTLSLLGEGTAAGASFQGIGNLGRLPRDRFDLSPVWRAGYAYTVAAAVSADGYTVVGKALAVRGDSAIAHGFVWNRSDGLRPLDNLAGYNWNEATDVSGDGSVIVGSCAKTNLGGQQACMWTVEGILGLGDLGGASRAYGVSADGKVVVGESLLEPRGSHAFRWEMRSGMVDLGDLPGAHEQSSGYDVSADGSVVVGSGVSRSLEAFRWEHASGLFGLGVLPGGRGWSSAQGVSADGTVIVGVSSPSTDPWESEACLWTSRGLQRLGDLPGGLVDSQAAAVSADGKIIVGSGTSDAGREAVLWHGGADLLPIRELLTAAGIDLTGWMLYEATDVSADGKVIVGNGINPDGNREGWILNLRDEEPPVIVSASASASTLWPPNHKMVTVNLVALVDDGSGEADWGVVGIECSEARPDGDMQLLDDHTVSLRATRSGNGAGRVYTVWLQAVDAAGNLSGLCPVEVVVPHDLGSSRGHGGLLRQNGRR